MWNTQGGPPQPSSREDALRCYLPSPVAALLAYPKSFNHPEGCQPQHDPAFPALRGTLLGKAARLCHVRTLGTTNHKLRFPMRLAAVNPSSPRCDQAGANVNAGNLADEDLPRVGAVAKTPLAEILDIAMGQVSSSSVATHSPDSMLQTRTARSWHVATSHLPSGVTCSHLPMPICCRHVSVSGSMPANSKVVSPLARVRRAIPLLVTTRHVNHLGLSCVR